MKFNGRKIWEKLKAKKQIKLKIRPIRANPAFGKIRMRFAKFWKRDKKKILISLAIIAACIIVVWVLCNIFLMRKIQMPKETSLPPVPSETLSQTDFSEFLDAFSPWENPKIKDSKFFLDSKKLALLKESGSIKVSSWGIVFPGEKWSVVKPPEITNMALSENRVTIMTNKNAVFTVMKMEPFVLEQMPKMVYLIDDGGKIWGINTDLAKELKYEIK